jgi:hypothetical protein
MRPTRSWRDRCALPVALADNATASVAAAAATNAAVAAAQAEIRAADPDDFPEHGLFMGYHAAGSLAKPAEVAQRVLPLLLQHPASLSGGEYAADSDGLPTLLALCEREAAAAAAS